MYTHKAHDVHKMNQILKNQKLPKLTQDEIENFSSFVTTKETGKEISVGTLHPALTNSTNCA
jgi:hypothetical protein